MIYICPVCEVGASIDESPESAVPTCPLCAAAMVIHNLEPAGGIQGGGDDPNATIVAKVIFSAGDLEQGAVTLSAGDEYDGYAIIKRIGTGSMGEVFLATERTLDRQVALKVLYPSISANPHQIERFSRTVQLQGKLEHPNIVAALKSGSAGGRYYLSMRYVDGDDLNAVLANAGRMSEKNALPIARDVALGLKYASGKFGVLHRDIKPANIMVDRGGRVHLMDLGISKSVHDETNVTHDGLVIGTPNYMSPEQARGQDELDLRTDIYSLGATLFHLITGQVPYGGTKVMKILSALVHDPTPSVRDVDPNVSNECDRLIQVMMAKDPDDRHGTWEDLIEDIDRVIEGAMPVAGGAAAPLLNEPEVEEEKKAEPRETPKGRKKKVGAAAKSARAKSTGKPGSNRRRSKKKTRSRRLPGRRGGAASINANDTVIWVVAGLLLAVLIVVAIVNSRS